MSSSLRLRSIVAGVLSALCLAFVACNSSSVSASGQVKAVNNAGSAAAISGPPMILASFGARLPRVCGSVMHQPNAAEAAALVQCNSESQTASSITDIQNVVIQTGGTRPFGQERDYNLDTVDVKAQILPIRGTETQVLCYATSVYRPVGHNCGEVDIIHAEGVCFKTTFGDWRCTMSGDLQLATQRNQTAPPTTY